MEKQITKEAFIKLYKSGKPLWKIGEEIGVTRKTVEIKATQLGLSRGKGFKKDKKFGF